MQLASLTCSLIQATVEQSLRLSNANGVVLLTLDDTAATFLRPTSAPSLDLSGSLVCSQSAVVGGPLYVQGAIFLQGTDILTLIAQSGGTSINSSSNLHVASIKAGNATPSEAGASAFEDLEAANIPVNNVRPPINTPLVLEAANLGEAVSIAANKGVVKRIVSTA